MHFFFFFSYIYKFPRIDQVNIFRKINKDYKGKLVKKEEKEENVKEGK